ncbi:unnamed protein product, partial [Mesorhabditis belari]
VVGRVAGQDLEIAGIRLKKGDKVQVDSYSIQRDKEIWGADAEEFKPDRWLDLTPNQKMPILLSAPAHDNVLA